MQGEGACHAPTPQVAEHPRWLAKYSYLNLHGELSYVDLHENNEYYYYPDFCGHPEDGGSHQLLGDPAGAAPDHGTSYVSGKHVERPGSAGGEISMTCLRMYVMFRWRQAARQGHHRPSQNPPNSICRNSEA